jgi:hypothetical protein
MTTIDRFDPFERRISDAIVEIADARTPDYLENVFRLTARSKQRVGWAFPERWIKVNRMAVAGAAAMIVLLVVGGSLLLGPTPNVGRATAPPSPTLRTDSSVDGPIVITAPPSPTLRPDPSLDGPIVLSASGGIYLVELNGTTEKLSIDGATDTSCPTFARHGRRFAVHTYDPLTNRHNLMVRSLDGVEHGLWDGEMSNSFHQIRWSANGTTLMMNGLIDGTSGAPQTLVADASTQRVTIYDWRGGELPGSFALSPDGAHVAVINTEGPEGPSRIDVHDLASGTTRTIASGFIGDVAWSPDGTTITYTASQSFGATADLHFMDADGSDDRIVARGEAAEGFGFMAWSNEWNVLGVLERMPTGFRIRVLDAAGSQVGQMGPFDRSPNLSFTWAPGGDGVLLTSSAGTGGLTGGPAMIAYLDGHTFKPGLPAGTSKSCPLGWGRRSGL